MQESLTAELRIVRIAREAGPLPVCLKLFDHNLYQRKTDVGALTVRICEYAKLNGVAKVSVTTLRSVLVECEAKHRQNELGSFERALIEKMESLQRQNELLKADRNQKEVDLERDLVGVLDQLQGSKLARARDDANEWKKARIREAEQWFKLIKEAPSQTKGNRLSECFEIFRLLKINADANSKADEWVNEICQHLTKKPSDYNEEVDVLVMELDSVLNPEKTDLATLKKRARLLLDNASD